MHKFLLVLFCSVTSPFIHAQSLVLAKQFHGNDSQINNGAVSDNSGNLYTISNFYDDLDADPGPGTVNFNSAGSLDFALIKLNSSGELIWAKQIGGTLFGGCYKLVLDSNGDPYIFGYFNGTIDMDPGPGTTNLVSSGSDDVFCGKYDADGNLQWAAKFGGTGTEQSYGFDLNAADHVFVHGYFQNTVDFNPGVGTFNLTAGVSGSDFLVELDANGIFQNAILMASAYGNALMIDPADNIYITGLFWNTVDFDPGPATHNLTASGFSSDAFILKLDSDGNYLWAGKFSGASDEQGTALAYDPVSSGIIVGGFYQGTMDANPDGGISNLISAGYVDAFIIKLNNDGTFIWAKTVGGLGFQQVTGLNADVTGNIHITGPFEQTTDFDPSGTAFNLTSNGGTDIFRLVLNSDGLFSTAEKIGGPNGDWSYTMEFDNTGSEIITGFFDGNVDFDPGPGTTNLNSAFTGWDGFLAKYCTVYNININVAICEGESYFAGGAFQTEPGDYYDYFDPVEGCDSIIITHLSINNPVVDLGPDAGFCAGNSILLDAENPGATYLWNTGATTQTLNVTIAGNYSVTITDASGCTASDIIHIDAYPPPVVDLGADISVCSGETVVLDAENPGATYAWNTGAVTQTINVTSSGNYGVVVTSDNGCTDNDIVTVTINANPVVDLGDALSFCANEDLILDAGNPGADYVWSTGAITQEITVSESGIYSVEVTNAAGCISSDDVTLTALPVPVVDLGDDITACAGDIILLDAENTGADFDWTTGDNTQTIEVTASGDYGVVVTNIYGCSESDHVVITINPSPILNLGSDIEFCENTSVILDAENPGDDYVWTTGETTQEIEINSEGTFGVTVTNDFGCSVYDALNATILPVPFVDLGADTAYCEGGIFILDATTPSSTYEWNTDETTPEIQISESGTYSVIVTNDFGCSDTDAITIEIYPLPETAFDLIPATICQDAGTYTLTEGSPAGGMYSGDGVTGDVFDPFAAGLGTHFISYTYTDAMGCSATATDEIEVTVCQGIEDLNSENHIILYPNPAQNEITIELHDLNNVENLIISDLAGRIVFSDRPQNLNTLHYDISFLPSGNYFVEIINADQLMKRQLIISK